MPVRLRLGAKTMSYTMSLERDLYFRPETPPDGVLASCMGRRGHNRGPGQAGGSRQRPDRSTGNATPLKGRPQEERLL